MDGFCCIRSNTIVLLNVWESHCQRWQYDLIVIITNLSVELLTISNSSYATIYINFLRLCILFLLFLHLMRLHHRYERNLIRVDTHRVLG